MQTCLLRDHGEHDGKAKVRGEYQPHRMTQMTLG